MSVRRILSYFVVGWVLCLAVLPVGAAQAKLVQMTPPALKPLMSKYRLKAFAYIDDPKDVRGTNQFSCLLFSPRSGRKPLPMLVYLPGRGGRGDVRQLFRSRTILELVTSEKFQGLHPCHLLAISPPQTAGTLWGGLPGRPSGFQQRTYGLIREVVDRRNETPVDPQRLYLTGYSYGGNGVYGLALNYPGVFAAAVPIAAMPPYIEYLSRDRPGNWWHFHNEGDYTSHAVDDAGLGRFRDAVVAAGGDFRIGSYPVAGHDAWTAAWREKEVWRWMFSKSIVPLNSGKGLVRQSGKPQTMHGAVCTSSIVGIDDGHGPERAVDGLAQTYYRAARSAGKGDWWRADFAEPVRGRFRVVSGDGKKCSHIKNASFEVSADGEKWSRAGRFSGQSEMCM